LRDTKSTQKRWLDAQMEGTTPLVNVLPSCLALCDLKNDGYFKLIAAEMSNNFEGKAKLKVFKGITLMSERGLPGFACGVSILYIDEHEPKIPIIAVALGSSVLLYRNLKPYFKYTLPSMDIEPLERDIWQQFQTAGSESIAELCQTLANGLETNQMTSLSQKLLSLPPEKRHDFIKSNLTTKLERLSNITAMTTLPKNSTEPKATMCLAVAAESGDIFILDSTAFTVLQQAKVCAFQLTPVLVSASGLFDVDYNMVISTREGPICILRKGWLEGQQIIRLDHPATGLALLPIEQTIIVVCMDKSLMCYSKRGKKIWFVGLTERAICMTHIILPHLGITLVAVALQGGRVQIYLQKKLVDEFDVEETVSSMIFGRLGQEEHVLVLVTITGILQIKILKRTAQFSTDSAYDEAVANQSAAVNNLQIPKKSKIFLEQTIRERDNAPVIHQAFQSELWRLRLHAARETLDIITSAEGSFSGDVGQVALKLAAEVLGTGPLYKLFLQIDNLSTEREAFELFLILHADHRHFELNRSFTYLPMIIPGCPVKMDFDVSIVMDPRDGLPPSDLTPENAVIKVVIGKTGQAKPVIASTVVIPLIGF
ncbi:LOW QUALITY PROTEIN: Bardet-Biedl syndrome 1 protein, partial [Culicoides brevitarsis]|uniref:LOW QUALITY PROTEIN: Bardet-Biedl syndrome 1 protein n=1 Tax=Culicoides brevitarsis TaxID=469753 RepID=UPI00307BA992